MALHLTSIDAPTIGAAMDFDITFGEMLEAVRKCALTDEELLACIVSITDDGDAVTRDEIAWRCLSYSQNRHARPVLKLV